MTKKKAKELNETERRLLYCLADEWEKTGPPGYIETSALAVKLGISIAKW